MGFSSRVATSADLAWCAGILDDGFERRPALKRELRRLWRRLTMDEALSMVVVVDDRRDELVAFGAGGILADEYANDPATGTQPHLALRLMEAELDGKHALLRPDAVRGVNHPVQGVTLCVLHYSEFVPGRAFDEVRAVRELAVAELLLALRGYATKEFVFEFYGLDDVAFTQVMGTRVRTDYSDFYASSGTAVPPRDRWPVLVGLRANEAAAAWGSPVGSLFAYLEPRLFFSRKQQEVLLLASRTPTPADPAIAKRLGIGRDALRDRWRTIFDRFGDVGLLGHVPRGPLLRPAVVAYLQQHPEELRPVDERHFDQRRTS